MSTQSRWTIDCETAAKIRGMLERGDDIADIAVWFGLPAHAVHAVGTGQIHPLMASAPASALPPRGPYRRCADAYAALKGIAAAEGQLRVNARRLRREYMA
jgi:hypothetical protein